MYVAVMPDKKITIPEANFVLQVRTFLSIRCTYSRIRDVTHVAME